MNKTKEAVLKIWDSYGKYAESMCVNNSIGKISNDVLIKEFFFVILGGYGISFELNQSALKVLNKKRILKKDLFKSPSSLNDTLALIERELSKKQFEPKTINNELRKYRFLNTKPRTITNAGYWLFDECDWEIEEVVFAKNIDDLREWLCECPGFGMKSASWYIRNTNISDRIAVLDVHILRFLKHNGFDIPKTITKKIYIEIENELKRICDDIKISLGKLDFLIWELGRNGFISYAK
ncbi:hypothetical protein KAU32_02755 [bacterium]|nr:hypothetical protein [bacterium]